ncbi:tectonin domain-containing protein [Streptomyces phaeoluteigriseus]|nr:tectonin domain-containing protein [Streptomyces phaeoluteigriseus]
MARGVDGRLQVFATDAENNVWTRSQVQAGGVVWTAWTVFAGQKLRTVAAEANADGRIVVVGVTEKGEIFHRRQLSGGGWSAWEQLSGFLASVAVARNRDGRLEIFGANHQGRVWHAVQVSAGSAQWSDWASFDDGAMRSVAAETNQDGRVELFAVNDAGDIFHRWQLAGGGWSSWNQIEGNLKSIAVARNGEGRLELFGTNSLDQVWRRSQLAPSGSTGWSGWTEFTDGTPLRSVAAEQRTDSPGDSTDGGIEVVGFTRSGEVFHRREQSAGGLWSGWNRLDGNLKPLFSVTDNTMRDVFVEGIHTPNAVVRIIGDVNLDISGLDEQSIAAGVQIIGDRTHNEWGPRLFTRTFPKRLFIVESDNQDRNADGVRFTGIRLDGGRMEQAETEEPDADAISIVSARNVVVEQSAIYGWRGAAVDVRDIHNRIGRSDTATMPLVDGNFLHHNQHQTGDVFGGGHGGGYGVVISRGAYARIEHNTFDYNRHAITGDGREGTGFLASHNLILPNGGWNTDVYHTHQVDMHGREDCGIFGSYNCGLAGEYMEFRGNTVLYKATTAVKLRGTPTVGFDVVGNVFSHPYLYPGITGGATHSGAVEETETGLHPSANKLNWQVSSGLRDNAGDFNGDGAIDDFMATTLGWWFGSNDSGWHYMRNSTVPLSGIARFTDADANGKTDIVRKDGIIHYS